MRFILELPSRTLNSDELDSLSRLIFSVADGWHEWCGPDPEQEVLFDYFERNNNQKELLLKSYAASSLYGSGSRTLRISVESPTVGESVLLSVALDLLLQPLAVMVENARNDGRALEQLLQPIDPQLVDHFHESRPPIFWQQGGGKGEIYATLKTHPAALFTHRRICALVDSDARWPNHETQETKRLKALCKDLGVPLYVLLNRSIENYIPDRYLAEYSAADINLEDSVSRILELNSMQRNHYPIKSGLRELKATEEKALFAGARAVHPDEPAKLPSIVEAFVSSKVDCETQDLASRDCLEEVGNIASFLRQEL